MAVNQTGAIYKAMTIDGESSRTYGVYITGSAVYNAPEREVEMISVPGRNGQLALDKGRFENIEVTYPAGIYADTEEDFAEAVSNFRNFLCSRSGYVRIEDDYNPDEYRMGIYKSGLEVETAGHKAGEFEIVFDCKPQRWLKSGETAITVSSGDVVANPTLFDASPLLEVEGVGDIVINNDTIVVRAEELGDIALSENAVYQATARLKASWVANMMTGDRIFCNSSSDVYVDLTCTVPSGSSLKLNPHAQNNCRTFVDEVSSTKKRLHIAFASGIEFNYETSSRVACSLQLDMIVNGTESTATIRVYCSYNGATLITLEYDITGKPSTVSITRTFHHPIYYGNSTKIVSPQPLYADLDIGEAYGEIDGEMLSLNGNVVLPSDLPKLKSGANTITFDDTITSLKIKPRWWKV